jgi:hypothetical protein
LAADAAQRYFKTIVMTVGYSQSNWVKVKVPLRQQNS